MRWCTSAAAAGSGDYYVSVKLELSILERIRADFRSAPAQHGFGCLANARIYFTACLEHRLQARNSGFHCAFSFSETQPPTRAITQTHKSIFKLLFVYRSGNKPFNSLL